LGLAMTSVGWPSFSLNSSGRTARKCQDPGYSDPRVAGQSDPVMFGYGDPVMFG
jgi:hypothetical protein